MLQTIREKLTGWFAVFILGAIALTLVVTFGNIDTGFTAASTAITVNGEDVPVNEFRNVYQSQRQQWETNFRTQVPAELAESMAMSVIDGLARNRVLSQHVSASGYRASDLAVIDSIESNEAFYVGGKFSQPAYEQLLSSQGLSTQRYEYEIRREKELVQFIDGVNESAFFTPGEFRRYIALDGETRDIEYLMLTAASWASQAKVSDEAIAERYEADLSGYQTEETVALEYLQIKFADIVADTAIGDAEAQSYYDENPQEFSGPEEREVSHILITFGDDESAAESKARDVAAQLAAGESFASLAASQSDDTGTAAAGGSLGWMGPGDAPAQEFEDALFALQAEGEYTQPVRTEFGFHLIRLDGLREGASLSFAEVSDELRARLLENAAADRFAGLVDELDDLSLESLDGLAPVAAAMGIELKTISEFTRNGGGDLGFQPGLVDTVFSLEVLEDGENSPVTMLADDSAVVARVTDYKPSEVKPLETVSDAIRAQLLQEEAIALGAVATAELVGRLNAGEAADAVLATFTSVAGMRRGDTAVPAELMAEVFRAPKPENGETVYVNKLLASGDFAIFRVTDSTPGRPDNFSQQDRDSRKRQLALRLGGGQVNGIVEKLADQATVQIAPDLFENTLGVGTGL